MTFAVLQAGPLKLGNGLARHVPPGALNAVIPTVVVGEAMHATFDVLPSHVSHLTRPLTRQQDRPQGSTAWQIEFLEGIPELRYLASAEDAFAIRFRVGIDA